jgi:hypothetical protein
MFIQVIMAFMVVTKYQRDEQYFEFFIEVVITYNKNKNIKIKKYGRPSLCG